MSRLANIRKSGRLLQGLIPSPYNRCRELCETEFSGKNNRKQCYSVCDNLRTASGFIDAADPKIMDFVGACSRIYSSDYNSKRCNSGVVQPILRESIQPELFREEQLLAQEQFQVEQAENIIEQLESEQQTQQRVTSIFTRGGFGPGVGSPDPGLFTPSADDPTISQAGFDFSSVPTWGWVALAAGGAYAISQRNKPKKRRKR